MEFEKMKRLAKEIQKNFKNFYLAGGTAVMLRHKHRISEDMDFFSFRAFSFLRLAVKMRKIFKVEKEERFEDNIDFIIEGLRISFVFFPFQNIRPLENFEGIKIASDYDIFLNKIYSAGRRIESKDVIDFAFLYRKYQWGIDSVKKDFEQKFPHQSFEIYLGAILSIKDYPDLDENTIRIVQEIKRELL